MGNTVRRICGLVAMVSAIVIVYVWSAHVVDDRTLTIMIAVTGLLTIITVDIPALLEKRRRDRRNTEDV